MGRPNKYKVSEATTEQVQEVVNRVAKKLKSFTVSALLADVLKGFQATTDAAELKVVADAVDAAVTSYATSGAYTVANGTYTVVAGKRGRPRKNKTEAAAAV